MKKNNSIKISIPKPCSQNFGEMPNKEGGLYCGKCENVVYDFSKMTDFELLNFFKSKPDVHCGRFHNSQLERTIRMQKTKYPLIHKFSKIAASVFAILSLKTQQVKAEGIINKQFTQSSLVNNKSSKLLQDSIIIKGNIKNEKNEMLSNAIVKIEGVAVTSTNSDGNYEFKLSGIDTTHNVYISCPNYVPVVRTYNPVMGSTVFDIVMGHRDSNAIEIGGHTGGIVMPFFLEELDLPKILFAIGSSKIISKSKDVLIVLGFKLKQNPGSNIKIIASKPSNKISKIQLIRLNNLKDFLTEKQGLSPDRIAIDIVVQKSNFNEFEILQNN